MKRLFLATLTLLALPLPAMAWGHDGHVIIAQIALARLHTHARAQVARVLAPGESLAGVSTWADEVREAKRHRGPLVDDRHAAEFNRTFPNSGRWHFVDLPLGTKAYEYPSPFTSDDDIVQAMGRCIDVLKSSQSGDLSRRDALALLVHFAGDIHMPLHVGCGYFTQDANGNGKLFTDPAKARDAASDRGGNQLFYTKSEELHAHWDVALVKKVMDGRSDDETATALEKAIGPSDAKRWHAPGDLRAWPREWAIDTLTAARKAYAGIAAYGPIEIDASHGDVARCDITLSNKYDEDNAPVAQEQLEKAGVRLAQMLDAIWP